MRWLLLLIWIACTAPAMAQSEVRFAPQVASASIGEEIVWELSAEYSTDAEPTLANSELDLDESWAAIGDVQVTRERNGTQSVTRWRWRTLSLEGGERRLPPMTLVSAQGVSLEVLSDAVSVSAELQPDEDAPRALAGFQEVRLDEPGLRPVHVLLTGFVLLALLTTFLFKRRNTSQPEPAPDARLRLAELRESGPSTPDEVRALHFELSSLVRFGIEERLTDLPQGLAGLTDEEWLEFVRTGGQLDDAICSQLGLVFSSCARVKYGLQVPTSFLMSETLTRAEDILTRLAPAEVTA